MIKNTFLDLILILSHFLFLSPFETFYFLNLDKSWPLFVPYTIPLEIYYQFQYCCKPCSELLFLSAVLTDIVRYSFKSFCS